MKTPVLPAQSLDRAERRLSELRVRHDRLTLLNRLSLHVGLWLLLRSARRRLAMTHEEHAAHARAEHARQAAERERVQAAFALWYAR